MSFGHHLRAHKDVDFPSVHLGEQPFGAPLETRGVRIDAGNAGLGKELAKKFFETLRTPPHRFEILVAAFRAATRDVRMAPTVVTLQPRPSAFAPMQHRVGRAARALAHPTT